MASERDGGNERTMNSRIARASGYRLQHLQSVYLCVSCSLDCEQHCDFCYAKACILLSRCKPVVRGAIEGKTESTCAKTRTTGQWDRRRLLLLHSSPFPSENGKKAGSCDPAIGDPVPTAAQMINFVLFCCYQIFSITIRVPVNECCRHMKTESLPEWVPDLLSQLFPSTSDLRLPISFQEETDETRVFASFIQTDSPVVWEESRIRFYGFNSHEGRCTDVFWQSVRNKTAGRIDGLVLFLFWRSLV